MRQRCRGGVCVCLGLLDQRPWSALFTQGPFWHTERCVALARQSPRMARVSASGFDQMTIDALVFTNHLPHVGARGERIERWRRQAVFAGAVQTAFDGLHRAEGGDAEVLFRHY